MIDLVLLASMLLKIASVEMLMQMNRPMSAEIASQTSLSKAERVIKMVGLNFSALLERADYFYSGGVRVVEFVKKSL